MLSWHVSIQSRIILRGIVLLENFDTVHYTQYQQMHLMIYHNILILLVHISVCSMPKHIGAI